jgi:hypothetical protein
MFAVIYKTRRGLLESESAVNMVCLDTRHEARDFSASMGKLRVWVKCVELTGIKRLDDMLISRIKEQLTQDSPVATQDLGREALVNRIAHLEAQLAKGA